MAVSIQSESARIYEFPLRPRRRLEDGRTVPASPYDATVSVVDQCWYHGEAVRDEPTKPDWPKPC
ncbi:DUF2735 domain-containing protein [Neorhizobium lilium]|uniref:DUF2735 domain-containing protein n=1 Tax=Neorhizobium lilium TaxID=2503024 RepID=A0A444LIH8_9HYPH|nr:DUF2735 domain-containing protein [Neorhizobium lilium]RWX78862.1 DUF2735 domain-containing protein [Neorhizobium lilium]